MLLIVVHTDARVIPSGLPLQGWHGSWNHPLDAWCAVDKAVETVDSRRLLRSPYGLAGLGRSTVRRSLSAAPAEWVEAGVLRDVPEDDELATRPPPDRPVVTDHGAAGAG